MNLEDAARSLDAFYRNAPLTKRISELELALARVRRGDGDHLLEKEGIVTPVLDSALLLKATVGQIHLVIHAVGTLLFLPHVLEDGESIEYLSLGAGNTGVPVRGWALSLDLFI